MRLCRRRLVPALLACSVLAVPAIVAGAGSPASAQTSARSSAQTSTQSRPQLPLGAANLPETRTTRTLAPGVTLTTIVRGWPAGTDPNEFWTAEVTIPSSSTDPDAGGSALSGEQQADATQARLVAAGLPARVEQVITPTTADVSGVLGYRVRVGRASSLKGATAIVGQIKKAGLSATATFTGWDGNAPNTTPVRGPWRIQVITIDPRKFRGHLDATYGVDLAKRETTSSMTKGALAAINGGFFVFDSSTPAPGDPTGTGVYEGQLERNANDGRPVLLIHNNGRGTQVIRTTWRGSVRGGSQTLTLDGLNRTPGVIQDCGGGSPDDLPTPLPRQGTTCTDASELIAYDGAYGRATPKGAGAQVDLDAQGRVISVHTSRGGKVPAGGRLLQAIGADAPLLLQLARAGHLVVTSTLIGPNGRAVRLNPTVSMVNGGPMLVSGGRIDVTPLQDGMASSRSFYYAFVQKRNPRTIAGVDRWGRTVLITADGRSTRSLGLSLTEAAAVAKSLGLIQAVNLDGGGSTTMVVRGHVINTPSDAGGQRTVGDAVAVYPSR